MSVSRAIASIFIGWLLKILILRYGGARLFRQVTPFFLGLIVGDVEEGAASTYG